MDEERIGLFNKNESSWDYGSVGKKKKLTPKDNQADNKADNIFKLILNSLTRWDKFLFVAAIVFSVICGICPPILGYFFGAMTNVYVRQSFQEENSPFYLTNITTTTIKPEYIGTYTERYRAPIFQNESTSVFELVSVVKMIFQKNISSPSAWSTESLRVPVSNHELHSTGNIFAFIFTLLGTILFLSTFLQSICWEVLSKRISRSLRQLMHDQLMKQEVAWHTTIDNTGGNSGTELIKKLKNLENIVKEDFGSIVQYISTFVSGLVVGLSVNPQLTLVTAIISPFLFGVSAYMTKLTGQTKQTAKNNPGLKNIKNTSNAANSNPSNGLIETDESANRKGNIKDVAVPTELMTSNDSQAEQFKTDSKIINIKGNVSDPTDRSKLLPKINLFGDDRTTVAGETATPLNSSRHKWLDGYRSHKNNNIYRQLQQVETNESEIVVDEALSNVKIVNAFGKQSAEIDRYKMNLNEDFKRMSKLHRKIALCIGVSNAFQFLSYCLAFVYGSYLINAGLSTPGTVFTIFFSIISSSFSIVNAFPSISTVASTSADASSVVEVVNRKPQNDPYSGRGLKLIRLEGLVEFKNISFSYPNTPETTVLRNFSINFEAGKVTALVGCGETKTSSLFELLVRHYEPNEGQVCLDGVPITDFNLGWLRKQISIVPKEPVLFNVSIAENIRLAKDDCTNEEIQQAIRLASAEEFILNLPQGYDTLINDQDVSLTKGEKQKIVIARSLVLNRKILLLDEASEVFDADEERSFLQLLESISKDHTIICIPRRIQMAQFADYIHVLKDGIVAESGTHMELMQKQGLYADMIASEADFQSNLLVKQPDVVPEEVPEQKISPSIRNESEEHEKPTVLLKKYKDDEGEYDVKFRMSGLDENDVESVDEPESDLDDDGPWRVLRRSVSEEALNDNNDDEYETIVTHVREKRLIKYNDDSDDYIDADDGDNEGKLEQPLQDDNQEPENNDEDDVFQLEPVEVIKPKKPTRHLSSRTKTRPTAAVPVPSKRQLEDLKPVGRLADIWTLQKPECLFLILIFICCTVAGFIPSLMTFYYGKTYQIYTLPSHDLLKTATIKWACIFLVLSILFGINLWLQALMTFETSELLIKRMKVLMFENILRHPVSWFDSTQSSSTDVLIKRLTDDVTLIKPLSAASIGNILTYAITIVCSLIIGYVYGLILTGDLFIFVPIVIFLSYIERILLERKRKNESQSEDESGKVAAESLSNINTIHELGQEKRFSQLYNVWLELSHKKGAILMVLCSLMSAIIQSIIVYLYSIGFKLGNNLVETNQMSTSGVYMVYFSVCFCTTALCKCFTSTRDYVRAKELLDSLIYVLKKKPDVDVNSIYGAKPIINGNISFHNVTFSYPSNVEVKALDCVDLTINAGKLIAVFGESKCGKSAIGYLIERFYDPDQGSVYIDDYEMRTLNVSYLREHIGVVTQQPVILDRTIGQNISYGSVSSIAGDSVSFFDIEKAAKLANVHNFIVNLPQGYNTPVGVRGIQLSVDQKQRIAIARALIRNPKILILDEPEFMLDAESTKIIQKTLDTVRQGRTTIVISRYTSMIRNADLIYVMYKGRILEQGCHRDLIEKGGYYSRQHTASN